MLLSFCQTVDAKGMLPDVLNEILLQSKLEFNHDIN